MLVNLYHMYSTMDIKPDVCEHMLSKLEARWKNADQGLFILMGLLNPYVWTWCINQNVLSCQDLVDLAAQAFTHIFQLEPMWTFRQAVKNYLEWKGDYTEEGMKLSMHLKDAGDKVRIRPLLILLLISGGWPSLHLEANGSVKSWYEGYLH